LEENDSDDDFLIKKILEESDTFSSDNGNTPQKTLTEVFSEIPDSSKILIEEQDESDQEEDEKNKEVDLPDLDFS